MLAKIKLLLGLTDTSKDALLELLIDSALQEAINYTRNDDIEDTCENTIMAMVVWRYNRLGTEGVDSENYSGVSFGYSADYPELILRPLKAYRKVMTIA